MPAPQPTVALLAAALIAAAGCTRHGDASATQDAPHAARAPAPRDVEGRPRAERETPPPAATTRVLRLTVLSEDGEAPVVGATIVRHDDHRELGRTDVDGAVRIELVDPPTAVDVWAPGFATSVVAGASSSEGSIDVALMKGVPARGRVVDAATGAPIAGAHVVAHADTLRWDDAEFGTATSGRDGRFEIASVPSHIFRSEGEIVGPTIECLVTAAGHVAAQVSRPPPEDAPFLDVGDVRLEPAAVVRVRVVHADGRPAVGVRVGVGGDGVEPKETHRPSWAEPAPDVRTDTAGEAVLDWMERDCRVWLPASTDDFSEMGAFEGVAVPRGTTEGRVEIRLAPRGRLLVRVRDADGTDVPAADSRVWIEPVDAISAGRRMDDEPRVVRGLRPGKWRIHAERNHGGSAAPEVDVAVGDNEATVVVGGRSTLAGRAVNDRGDPVPRALIELYDPAGLHQAAVDVDRDGAFRIERLAEGAYELRARSDDQGVGRMNVTAPARDVLVVIERLSFATGRLHAPDGIELPERGYVRDVTDDAKSRRADDHSCDVTDGIATAVVESQGRRDLAIHFAGFEDVRVTVDLVAGEKRSFGDVTLVPLPAISGRIVDENGHAVPNATYLIRSIPTGCGHADAAGEFRVPCSRSWRGVVLAWSANPRSIDWAPALGDLAGAVDADAMTSRDELVVKLRPTSALHVRVEEPREGRSRVREIQVLRPRDGELFFVGWAAGQGRARIPVLPGEWIVRAVDDDRRTLVETPVDVSSVTATPREITLTLR